MHRVHAQQCQHASAASRDLRAVRRRSRLSRLSSGRPGLLRRPPAGARGLGASARAGFALGSDGGFAGALRGLAEAWGPALAGGVFLGLLSGRRVGVDVGEGPGLLLYVLGVDDALVPAFLE